MNGKNKEEIDENLVLKRESGSKSIRLKLSKMLDPVIKQNHIKKQIQFYKNHLHEYKIEILRKKENTKIAEQLFLKNKFREELKLYCLEQAIETTKLYLTIMKEKPKKQFVPPDPVKEILEEKVEPIPEPPKKPLKEVIESLNKAVQSGALEPITEKTIEQIEEEIAEIEAITEFKCPHCDRIYATEKSRKRHITMRHKEV